MGLVLLVAVTGNADESDDSFPPIKLRKVKHESKDSKGTDNKSSKSPMKVVTREKKKQ